MIDGKAEKYNSISPYAYAVNNPIRFLDPDGNKIVDSKGNIVYTSTGGWIKGVDEGTRRIGENMMKTTKGSETFELLSNAQYDVTLTLAKGESPNGKIGSMLPSYDESGYNLVSADITIYEGSISKYIEVLKDGLNHNARFPLADGSTSARLENGFPENKADAVNEVIGQTGVHEGTHALRKDAQERFNKDYESREEIARESEVEAIKQSAANRNSKKSTKKENEEDE